MTTFVYAVINQDGGIEHQSGQIDSANSKRLGKGRYQLKFKSGTFSQEPVVLATVETEKRDCGEGGTNRTISVTNVSSSEVCIGIKKAAAGDEKSDRPFHVLAVGA